MMQRLVQQVRRVSFITAAYTPPRTARCAFYAPAHCMQPRCHAYRNLCDASSSTPPTSTTTTTTAAASRSGWLLSQRTAASALSMWNVAAASSHFPLFRSRAFDSFVQRRGMKERWKGIKGLDGDYEDEEKEEERSNATTNANASIAPVVHCPACGSDVTYCVDLGSHDYRCCDCDFNWKTGAGAGGAEGARSSDVSEADGAGGGQQHLDASGVLLADGDTVVLVKDLKVKGSSTVLKRGSKVKSIRLVHGVHDGHSIDCRFKGRGTFMLKPELLRKV